MVRKPVSHGRWLELVGVGEEAGEAWRKLCRDLPSVRPTQTPTWLECVTADGRHEDATRLYRTVDGRDLVMPMVRRRGVPKSMPVEDSWPEHWDFAGPLATGGVGPADIRGLVDDLISRRVLRTGVRAVLGEPDLRVWETHVPDRVWRAIRSCQILDLSGGFDEVWRHRFTGKVRSACRKAVRLGVRVETSSGDGLVPAFDSLYRKSVDRWAAERNEPAILRRWLAARREPSRKFARVAVRLGDACRLWVAYRDDEPVAGIIVLTHGDQVTYWRGAMDKGGVARTGANELLHRCAIERACEQGARAYDMGVSVAPSLARFKHTFGAGDAYIAMYRFETISLSRAETAVRSASLQTARRLRRL